MNQKITTRVTQAAGPLAQNERIQLVEAVQIGKVSAKKQIATSAIVGIASAGTLIVTLRPRAYYLVLTDQRMILVDNLRGRVGKVAAAIRRDAITAEPLRGHLLTLSMNVTVDGTPQRLSWGRAQSSMARRVADALTAANVASAA